jgi:hypothetical protein
MAYALGLFAADGLMLRNSRGAHFIEFHITDKDILFQIRTALGSSHCVSEHKGRPDHKTLYRLQIGSKMIFSDLKRLGFSQAKSTHLAFPDVPDP